MTRILMILTSHDRLGDTGGKTGFWLEEFAAPYYVFRDAGAQVVLGSPKGGQPPVDPKSHAPEWQTAATQRLAVDEAAQYALAHTRPLSELHAEDFDALFVPGGHGPMWDFPADPVLARLVSAFAAQGKPVAAVCHGPAALLSASTRDGVPLVEGRRLTAFTDTEEVAVGLAEVVPFSLQQRRQSLGARFVAGPDFAASVQREGFLITGQNPASSAPAAVAVLEALRRGELRAAA